MSSVKLLLELLHCYKGNGNFDVNVRITFPRKVSDIEPNFPRPFFSLKYTVIKKEKKIFLIWKEIQMRSVAKSSMITGFLIYEEIRKYLTIYV
jgi:hypothetical protein